MKQTRPSIAVVGSINMDLVLRCSQLPLPGETVFAESSAEICGGKGANQAVAAARAGGDVTMVGRVGDDAFAAGLLQNLRGERINCDWIRSTAGCATGFAVVAVEQSGQNSIMVVGGANGTVCIEDVRAARTVIEQSDVVLVQLEIPLDAALCALQIARECGVRVILDPAPAPRQWPPQLLDVDLVCPNASEAGALVGATVDSLEAAEHAARRLHQLGARHVAITLGEDGALLFDGTTVERIGSFAVTAVDTTAAGDAFAGALAVRWAETDRLTEAVRFANAAGALAASRVGAQPSMAARREIDALSKERK